MFTVTVFLVFGLMLGIAGADPECVRYGQGYWKSWLADDSNANAFDHHTNKDLLDILNTDARRGNEDIILSYQFIAAALNVEVNDCSMPDKVQEAFDYAQEYLHGDDGDEVTRQEILGWKDILEFWNTNQKAELESVVYEGTCNLFGSHIGDTMTFTFSNDVFHVPNVEVKFQTAIRLWEGWGADNWTVSGNVATLTLNRVYSSPRDVIGDKVISITGLGDFIDNPVVVPSDGVEVEGIVTYDMVDTWKLRADRLIVIDYQINGEFSGKLTDAGGMELGNINGTIDGDVIEMYYDRVGYVEDGYYAEFTGNMIDCNTASGTYIHGNYNVPRPGIVEWTMFRQ